MKRLKFQKLEGCEGDVHVRTTRVVGWGGMGGVEWGGGGVGRG